MRRKMMMVLVGGLAVGTMSVGALAQEAESEALTEVTSEAEYEEGGLGALIDTLLGEGSEAVAGLTDAANGLLGEDGELQKLLGPDSKISESFRLLVGSLQDAGSELSQSVNELADSLKEEGGEIGGIVSEITDTLTADGQSVSESIGDMLSGFVGEDGAIDVSGVTSLISMFTGTGDSAAMLRDMYREELESTEDGPLPALLKQYILDTNADVSGTYQERVPVAGLIDFQTGDEDTVVLADLWEIDGHIEENVFVAEGYVQTTEFVTVKPDEDWENYTLIGSEVVGEDGTLDELMEKYGFAEALYESNSRSDQPALAVVEAALRLKAAGEEIDAYRLGEDGEDLSIADGEEELLDAMTAMFDASSSEDTLSEEEIGLELSEEELAELEALLAEEETEALTETFTEAAEE